MTILTKSEILVLIQKEGMVTGYGNLDEQLQPNGFDLRLDTISRYNNCGELYHNDKHLPELIELKPTASDYYLFQGNYSFSIMETVKLPIDICAITVQRSSVMRCGVITNIGFWDSGYNGRGFSQLMVNNPNGFWIREGTKIIQMIFLRNTKETEGYKGQYQYENIPEFVENKDIKRVRELVVANV